MTSATHIHGEEAIIQEFLAPLAAGFAGAYDLKDDCAAITPTAGHDLVVKTDPVAEGIHFFSDDAPETIAWRALAVNVSDLAAKAAVPVAYLMALSFPTAPTRDWMQRFAAGLGAAQRAFGMHLIGGDTDRRPGPITISITVFGEVPSGTMVQRAAAQPGHRLFVSGALGSAAIGLKLRNDPGRALLGTWGIPAQPAAPWQAAIDAYLKPQPRLGLRAALRAHAAAAMDVSDGLAKDLGRMCKASGCAARVSLDRLPLIDVVRAAVTTDPSHWTDVVASGDDYEILAAVAPGEVDAFVATAARDGMPVTEIGVFRAGSGVEILDAAGVPLSLTRTGWDHF